VISFTLAQQDAVTFLARLPNDCIDLCVTDPAYESLEKHRAIGTTTRLTKAWFPIFPNARFGELFAQLYRVMKLDTHLYVVCDQETMFVAVPEAKRAGFTFWKPIIWDKVAIGMGYHYRARYEVVLFFEKGSRQLNDLGMPDILTAKRVRNGYPTEKPLDLLRPLISQSTQPGQLVLDPFMGSGSTGAAAHSLGRDFIGCDVADEAMLRTRTRLTDPTATEKHELPRGQPALF
jgi:site-specific DNA-methyltransferase (adenine-specific)